MTRRNKVVKAGLKVDGGWDKATVAAVNKSLGYKETNSIGSIALKRLLV